MAANTSTLPPADAAVALASFGRRYRAAFAVPTATDNGTPDDPDELARRHGADGTSGIDHLVIADGLASLLVSALGEARRGADVVVHPAVFDANERAWTDENSTLADLLDQFAATTTDAAALVRSIDAEAWGGPVQVAGRPDGATTLIDLVRSVVAALADELDAASTALREAMRRER